MINIKKTLAKLVIGLLMISCIPATGCRFFDRINDTIGSRSAQQKEENKRSFSTMHEFEKYYSKEIKDALKKKNKAALKYLFSETVLENTYDIDEGLEYVFSLEDWSDFTFSDGECSSYKTYGSDIWEYVFCHFDLSKGNLRYRILYSGYSRYRGKAGGKTETIKENLGLARFYIAKLDFKSTPLNDVNDTISGVYYPGRENLEVMINTVLNTYESKNKDGSYIDSMTDEAIGSLITDNLKQSADKDELEAFIRFIRCGSMSKKKEYVLFLNKNGKDITLTSVVHFKLNDHCLTMLIKNDQIDGATFSDDGNSDKPESGKITGFAGIVD